MVDASAEYGLVIFYGAGGGTRTHHWSPKADYESDASTVTPTRQALTYLNPK